jgi:hypothetical protein
MNASCCVGGPWQTRPLWRTNGRWPTRARRSAKSLGARGEVTWLELAQEGRRPGIVLTRDEDSPGFRTSLSHSSPAPSTASTRRSRSDRPTGCRSTVWSPLTTFGPFHVPCSPNPSPGSASPGWTNSAGRSIEPSASWRKSKRQGLHQTQGDSRVPHLDRVSPPVT